MNITSIIRSGRSIRGCCNDMTIYADPWELSAPSKPHESKYQRHVHYRIVYEPCDVPLHPDIRLSKEDVEYMLRCHSLVLGTVLESNYGRVAQVVEGKCGAYRLGRANAEKD